MQHNGLDRRTFLKGAGITAIGAAAMGALTGCGNGFVERLCGLDGHWTEVYDRSSCCGGLRVR